MCLDGFYQAGLDFGSCIVLMMQDSELRMSAFFVEVEVAVFVLVEIYPPADKFLNLGRRFTHHFLDGCPVAYPVAGNHRILNVLFKIVHLHVSDRSDASLCIVGIRFFQTGLTNQGHFTLVSYLQCIAHTGYSRADDKEIEFSYHKIYSLYCKTNKFLVSLCYIYE